MVTVMDMAAMATDKYATARKAGKTLLWSVIIVGGLSLYSINSETPEVSPQPAYPATIPSNPPPPTTQYQPRATPTYNGYACSDDCSGHEAGYEYAEENDLTQDDVDEYSGNSESFREGMQSYVDEQ